MPSLKPFKDDLLGIGHSLLAIATETEKTAERFNKDKSTLDDRGRYYQFNVIQGLEDIGLEQSTRKNVVIAATDRYLESQAVFKQMRAFGNSLAVRQNFGPYSNLPHPPPPSFRNKHFDVPRNASSVFTGREEICEQLHARCLASSISHTRGQQKRYVIHGLGGSGKTQVCLKFAEDHREEFWGVFWVDASSTESLERGYLQVAKVCGLEANVDVARGWLSNIPELWALIVDNADDPRLDLSPYFPVGNRGIILITSRNPESTVHATVGSYELGAMSMDEAVTLMLKTAGVYDLSTQLTRETAKPVVQTLGCLALAITQAGAVIRQGRCRIDEYRTLYAQRRKELLSQKAIQGGDSYRYTVYTTWEVSRQMIEEISSEAGQYALELLQVFSFLHYEGISEEIFSRAHNALRNRCDRSQLRIRVATLSLSSHNILACAFPSMPISTNLIGLT
ncbi:hypothetical protein N7G274_003844 [Stereocaulon virgatum]|uniref:NB-ARC domain-containing protein n=1 Tax=Stereocaulon virgatum TaxID=373712 RepID=A0ABR4ACG6_9LECA